MLPARCVLACAAAAAAAAGAAYLNYVGLLNQAVMMSTQLYNDATNPAHHKYAAHQVALLYVSVLIGHAAQGSGLVHLLTVNGGPCVGDVQSPTAGPAQGMHGHTVAGMHNAGA